MGGASRRQPFAGISTLLDAPQSETLDDLDIALIGVPMDLGVTNRNGARFGPRSIREASMQLAWGEVWPWGFDPFDCLAVLDAGDRPAAGQVGLPGWPQLMGLRRQPTGVLGIPGAGSC